jgi:LysM repeat protein
VFLVAQTTTPVPVQISERIENINGTYHHLHTVEKGQTLYSISRAYQVRIEEIKRTIDKPEIQVDEILLIPVSARRLRTLRRNDQLPEIKSEHIEQKSDTETVDTVRKNFSNPPKSTLNVALMLPLFLNEIDRINPRDSRTLRPFSSVSFYEGAMLAARAFDDENVKINMQVFDVTDDHNTAVRLINSGKLNNVDIIIGHLFLRAFGTISDYAKQHNIFIINPLSKSDNILDNNPYVIKINTSEKNQLHALLNYVEQENFGQRILVLSNDSLPNEKERSEQAKLFFEMSESDFDTIIFFDISKDRFPKFNSSLSNTKRNAIVYLSNNEAFVTEILAQVSKRENASDVLYCSQKLPRFEFTELLYLNSLQTHYVDPFFVNHDDEKVKNFERLFFETYQTIPDTNAYRGYDVMDFALGLLKIGNANYNHYLTPTQTHELFHNSIRLQRTDPSRGLENQETNILKIENSKLKKVNRWQNARKR